MKDIRIVIRHVTVSYRYPIFNRGFKWKYGSKEFNIVLPF